MSLQNAALGFQAKALRDLAHVDGGLVHPAHVRRQPGGVGQRRHLDLRLRAVAEGVVHLAVDRAPIERLRIKAKAFRHGVRRARAVVAVEDGTAPRRHDLKAQAARPIDQVHDAARLVAIHQRVDDARCVRQMAQNRPHRYVRLHVDHDNVLFVRDRLVRHARANLRDARHLDDHIDACCLSNQPPIFHHHRLARSNRVVNVINRLRRAHLCPRDATVDKGLDRALRRNVRNDDRFHAAHLRNLRHQRIAKFPHANHAHADRVLLNITLN